MSSITEDLQTVAEEITVAQARIAELTATWNHQCAAGVLGAAEATEEEIVKQHKLINRLTVQHSALTAAQADVEAAAHKVHLAGLTADADAAIVAVEATLSQIIPLTAALAAHVTALTAQAEQVRHSRILAKQQGATASTLNNFATQTQAALVRNVVDSLGRDRLAIANICAGLSRLSLQ